MGLDLIYINTDLPVTTKAVDFCTSPRLRTAIIYSVFA